MKRDINIGVLALQGAFAEHINMLKKLDVPCFEIRQHGDLTLPMDGLILPGGESTVQGKLLKELGMFDELRERIMKGLPVYGTCAGLLLLAKEIENDNRKHFSAMDIKAKRNAYGRQLGSFIKKGLFADKFYVSMPFIRAPYIAEAGEGVEVLAEVDNHVVAAREKNMLVTSFHPEVTEDTRIHEYFIDMVLKS